MTAADLRRVAEATDIRQLIGSAIRLRKLPGHSALGLCPFHNEKTPSFRVNLSGPHAGKWRCHGCGLNGDCFDFLMRLDSCDLRTAAKQLASDAGITLTEKPETPAERRERERLRTEKEIFRWWMKTEWMDSRRRLNRAMALLDVNPFAEDLAGIHGARLRWIEANVSTPEGLAEFRRARIPERRYREWLTRRLRRYAAMWEFAEMVLRT